jgi:creatinine amidohydrolase/Fe(II)-dependent formamide hydrolase-like protein
MPPLFPVLRRAPAPTVLSGALLALALMAPAASLAAQPGQRDPRSMGGGQCSANPYNCADAPNPLPAATTVWLEEMTWMDVRDALKAGKTTAIITTGGMEPNGPFLVTGKHNYVLRANCEAIAKALGNALCAPTIKFVPEGGIDPKTSHMTSPGTISLREATFRGLLTDVVHSLKQHGFTRVILIGDSGGNQGGQRAVADSLTAIWKGAPIVAHIQEYYDYASVSKHMEQFGLKDTKADGLHDDPVITLNMWTDDPRSVRLAERKKAGLATINGVSVADEKQNRKWADEIVAFRTRMTVEAIAKATAHGGTLPAPARRGSQE